MKIRILNWVNLVLAIILMVVAILNFIAGDVVAGISDIIIAGLNLFAFLLAVDSWWIRSDKVSNKFVFTCPKCEHQAIPTFWTWFFVPHFGSRRYMKCEKCTKISWMRRK